MAALVMTAERRGDSRTSFEFRSVEVRAWLDGKPVEIINMGRSGLLARGAALPETGRDVRLSIPGLGDARGRTVWSRNGIVGVSIEPAIGEDAFRAFLAGLA